MVGRIGGRISVITEWLGKQILDGFLREFQTSRGHKQRYNVKLQRYLTILKLRVLLTFSVYTVSQIKTPMRTIVHNFVKFLPIFTIL